jgi:hypothetical protein
MAAGPNPLLRIGAGRSDGGEIQATARATPKRKRPKGILGRAWAVATGVGGAIQAPLGLVKDFAVAPFTDDEYGGIIDTIWRAPLNRGGQVVGNLIGPDEGLGAAIGGIPGPIRERLGNTIEGAAAGGLTGAGAGGLVGGIGAIPGAIGGAIGGAAYGAVTNRSAFEDLETVGRERQRATLQ